MCWPARRMPSPARPFNRSRRPARNKKSQARTDVPPPNPRTAALGLLPARHAAAGRQHHHHRRAQRLGQDHAAGRVAHAAGAGVLGRPHLPHLCPPCQCRDGLAACAGGQPAAQPAEQQPAVRQLADLCRPGHAGLPHRAPGRRLDAPLCHRGRRRRDRAAGREERPRLAGHRGLAQAPGGRWPDARHRPRAGAGAGPDRPALRAEPEGAAAPGVRGVRRPGGAGPLRAGAQPPAAARQGGAGRRGRAGAHPGPAGRTGPPRDELPPVAAQGAGARAPGHRGAAGDAVERGPRAAGA
mmetsp:Transcript_4976/g.18102  ORF Transcript_4976/g.18102 Transcript_4976/m.18102 type:complete len:297 (-) Transcript_4976:124-1014(-)